MVKSTGYDPASTWESTGVLPSAGETERRKGFRRTAALKAVSDVMHTDRHRREREDEEYEFRRQQERSRKFKAEDEH